MRVAVRNNSSQEVNSTYGCAVRISITDSHGNPVPKTEHQIEIENQLSSKPIFRRVSIPIFPGQTQTCELVISEMYQLSNSATYIIQMERGEGDKSNALTFATPKVSSANRARPLAGIGGGATPPVAIQLSTRNEVARTGSRIWLDITTTNLTTQTVPVGLLTLSGPYESDYLSLILRVRNDKNEAVGPEEVDQESCKGNPQCRVMFLESRYLTPGQSIMDHVPISDKFDMSKPGVYSIDLIRRDKPPASSEFTLTAISNKLTINVISACDSFATKLADQSFAIPPEERLARCDTIADCANKWTAPLPIIIELPKFSSEAEKTQIEGKVVLGYVVDTRGKTENVRVLRSLNDALDQNALIAVQKWRYKPALHRGSPVAVHAIAELEFGCRSLNEKVQLEQSR